MSKIQFKRGLEKDIPKLSIGEPGYTTDTHKLFVGSASGNIEIAKIDDLNTLVSSPVIPNSYSWVSTNGQDTFQIPNGKFYDIRLVSVTVGGVVQPNITLIDNKTFQLPETLSNGVNVYAEWYEVPVPVTSGHHSSHEAGGADEIDITKLKNFDQIASVLQSASSVTPNSYSWISTDGQDTFQIPTGKFTDVRLMDVTVGGVIQTSISLIDDTTFQLPETLSAGLDVYVEWYETPPPITVGGVTGQLVNEYEWTATEGQLTYVLPSNTTYDPYSKWFDVYVGGAIVSPSIVRKDSSSQFTLLCSSSDINAGMKVLARWTEPYIPATNGHHSTHELNGSDEIDVTKLRGDIVLFPLQMGAVGNENSNDANIFANFESTYQDKIFDLQKNTFAVNTLPTKNIYVNGKFKVGTTYFDASYTRIIRSNHGIIALGLHAAEKAPMYPSYSGSLFYKNIALGNYAMQNSVSNYNNIAIGQEAMRNATSGEYYNLAIGGVALWNLNKQNDGDQLTATRNLAIGSNSMYFATKAYQNAAVGRNSLQCIQNGVQNISLGVNSMSGDAPLDLSGNIANYSQSNASNNTAVGYNSLKLNTANNNTAVGSNTVENVTKATNVVAVGKNSLNALQKDMTNEGNNRYYSSKTGTYTWNGTNITVTMTAHGFSTGWTVSLGLTSGATYSEENHYTVTVIDANTFTVTSPITGNSSGSCTSSWYSDNIANTKISDNNTSLGAYAMENVTSGQNNVAIGTWANRNNISDFNTMVGSLSGTNLTTGGNNTGVGYGSLRYMIDGTNATTITGSTALGYNSRVSGNNQVQLGYSGTTTYAYGAVQDRSDMRDKADIQDTPLGLDFINKIRPVQFKWDMRDDYIQINEETGKVTILPKDGSKKRERFHQGVIAQEVKQVIDETGLDFGGFQDHNINGGSDVLTVGYEEFIAPLIKSVQELTARVKELESKLNV